MIDEREARKQRGSYRTQKDDEFRKEMRIMRTQKRTRTRPNRTPNFCTRYLTIGDVGTALDAISRSIPRNNIVTLAIRVSRGILSRKSVV